LDIVMDIVIDIQDFWNVNEKFIPKEAVVAINATIIGYWIMISPCLFSDLPERVRREINWQVTSAVKVLNSEFIQTIPFIRTPPINDFSRSLTSIMSVSDMRLSCRKTAESVNEVDCHHR